MGTDRPLSPPVFILNSFHHRDSHSPTFHIPTRIVGSSPGIILSCVGVLNYLSTVLKLTENLPLSRLQHFFILAHWYRSDSTQIQIISVLMNRQTVHATLDTPAPTSRRAQLSTTKFTPAVSTASKRILYTITRKPLFKNPVFILNLPNNRI